METLKTKVLSAREKFRNTEAGSVEAKTALNKWGEIAVTLALSAQSPKETEEAFLLTPGGSTAETIARAKKEYWQDLKKLRVFFKKND